MITGALIFAFNNETTDYVRMAAWCAQRVQHYLGIPVAIATDRPDLAGRYPVFDRCIPCESSVGGRRYFEDYDQTVTWYNGSRHRAYYLTPWDRTLVLDADYVVCSSSLGSILEADCEFTCHNRAFDLARGEPMHNLNKFGRWHLPMSWATVMMFDKSIRTQFVFDSMHMIAQNWQHYRDIYGIDAPNYRNDFALSIALSLVNGHAAQVTHIPFDLMTVTPDVQIKLVAETLFQADYRNAQGQLCNQMFAGIDFHAMGKHHLEKIIATH